MPKKDIICLLVIGFGACKISIFLFSSRCFPECEILNPKYFTTGFHNCSFYICLFLLTLCPCSAKTFDSDKVSVLQSISVLDAMKRWFLHGGSNFTKFEDIIIEKMVGLSQ